MEIKVKTAVEWYNLYAEGDLTLKQIVFLMADERDEAIAKLEAEIKDLEDRDLDALYDMKERDLGD
jgi:hypothetical protein